jgi:flavin-dependent dehydrogenase
VAPRGGQVDVPGQLAVLPRKQLDEVLRRAAVAAGAVWLPGAKFEGPLEDAASADSPEVAASASARVQGAQLRVAGQTHAVRAPWVVLATGAATQALTAAGMCERRAPTGMALRGYVRHPELAKRLTTMDVVWHRALGRGYGWIFPCRDGVFNIGAGLSQSHSVDASGHDLMADVNLRELFDTFCRVHEPARELMAGGELLGGLKGAPLRCSLEGAKLARPGLLVTGEAAGSTYAFTGEGIGKAMETGLIAAETLLDTPDDATAVQRYAERVLALKPRFDLYERANKVNQHPWLIDLLFWRARRSPRILRRMAGVLEEKGNPGNLVSVKGVLKLFMPLR